MTRCAHDTGRVGVKSSALWGSVRNAALEAAESRVQITSVVSNVAHESCTGAAVVHDSGFAASTSRARATVRRTPNCLTAHLSKHGKQHNCVLYAISFSAVGGATSVLELLRADIFFTSNVAWISRRLQLWCMTRDDTAVCDSRRRRLTFRTVAATDRNTIAIITARHDCITRNRNEYWSFLPDWREMRR